MISLFLKTIDDCHVMMTKMHDLIKLFCKFLAVRYDKSDELHEFDQENFDEFVTYYNEDLTLSAAFSSIARDAIQICDSRISQDNVEIKQQYMLFLILINVNQVLKKLVSDYLKKLDSYIQIIQNLD